MAELSCCFACSCVFFLLWNSNSMMGFYLFIEISNRHPKPLGVHVIYESTNSKSLQQKYR